VWLEPQSQHSNLGFFKLMPRASVIRTFEFTNQVDQISHIRICFLYPVLHGAWTLPISSPSYYILLILLVSPGPFPIDQVLCTDCWETNCGADWGRWTYCSCRSLFFSRWTRLVNRCSSCFSLSTSFWMNLNWLSASLSASKHSLELLSSFIACSCAVATSLAKNSWFIYLTR